MLLAGCLWCAKNVTCFSRSPLTLCLLQWGNVPQTDAKKKEEKKLLRTATTTTTTFTSGKGSRWERHARLVCHPTLLSREAHCFILTLTCIFMRNGESLTVHAPSLDCVTSCVSCTIAVIGQIHQIKNHIRIELHDLITWRASFLFRLFLCVRLAKVRA